MQKIFVIEDDENIRELLRAALKSFQYEVRAFETAEEALSLLVEEKPELAIFDWMLPGMDGVEAVRTVRRCEAVKDMPVMLLTAKDKEYDKVAGLDGGADDYITKPFGVLELAARIRSLLRRSAGSRKRDGNIRIGELFIDTGSREVWSEGEKTALTYKEYELLTYLIKNRGRAVPREELLDELWDYNAEIETRTLDIHIMTLRQKLGAAGSAYIKTVRSVGYRFAAPEEEN